MSFKQALKAKLPFTRRGLEDYLDEKLALMQRQQADSIENQIKALTARLAQEMNAQLDRRTNDLQTAVIAQLTAELNAQLHRRINDLDGAITFQTETLTAQFAQEMNTQLDRRTNDLQTAVIAQLTEELNTQLHRRINDLDSAITFQTETLTAQFAQEMNTQLDRRTNDLQTAVIAQLTEELNAQLHRRINDLDSAITFQTEALAARFAQEMNAQLHRRTNDLDRAVSGVRNELYGFFRRFPKTMLNFEVALAEHCNLNCVGCNHFSPLATPNFADLEEFVRDFKRMADLFGERVQQIKLLGGEPLLNREINQYLLAARASFPHAEIMIITNGLLLPKMDETFWETCRENQIVITPTRYPVNFDYGAAEKLAQAHNVNYHYFAEKENTKVFEKYALDPRGLQDCEGNYRMCFMANSCIHLLHGHLYTCPIAPTAHYLNEAFGTQIQESPYDSIDIYQAKSAEEILEFLAKPIPFCRYCRRDVVIDDIPWRQSKRELSEWTL